MNIKRLADQYREQVTKTGQNAQKEMKRFFGCEDLNVHYFSSVIAYLRNWERHFKKSLPENTRRLENLNDAWKFLKKAQVRFNENGRSYGTYMYIGRASKSLDKFLTHLPDVIEESLTESIKNSGIKLP